MRKKEIIDVREFDLITDKENVEHKNSIHINQKQFERLVEYTREFDSDTQTDVLQFLKMQYRRNLGQVITTNNYVGLIQVNKKFGVQILPKIDLIESEKKDDQIKDTKEVFIDMLKCMPDFKYKIFDDAS